ncbi:MAG: alpha/beta hydrolase, partial [Leptothrix sp. (in: b-proteobacteria)]
MPRRPSTDLLDYRAPPWLPGGNLQTLWAATRARRHDGEPVRFRRERWTTPDGDFIDVDHAQAATAGTPAPRHLVLFHGLEG